MTIILIEDVNLDDLKILLESENRKKLVRELKSDLELVISHMLKYKHKGYLQTNSWINTIVDNYNRICELIKDKSIFNYFTEDDYIKFYNKIYKDSEKEQSMKFNESEPIMTYFDLTILNRIDIKKFLFDYNINKELIKNIERKKIYE